jgi:hypothetical protein
MNMLILSKILIVINSMALCQVTLIPRDQPSPVYATDVFNCCDKRDNPMQLYKCINDVNTRKYSRVAVTTYVTENILEYASYSLFINALHTSHNNYTFRILTNKNSPNYEVNDPRWNKVKIINVAMEENIGWASDSEYVVWLDADLAILDIGMDFAAIGDKYPNHDVFLSKDINNGGGIANTGFVMVRNTKWAMKFLDEWFNYGNRARMSDQIALLLLYESYDKIEQNKIKILNVDAINSNFPAWRNQKDYNQVLHLAGESNLYRDMVFQYATTQICDIYNSNINKMIYNMKKIPRQLGLSQEKLYEIYSQLTDARTIELKNIYEKTQKIVYGSDDFDNFLLIDKIHSETMNTLTHAEISENTSPPTQEYYNLIRDVILWCFTSMSNVAMKLGKDKPNNLRTIDYIRHSISTGFDLFARGFQGGDYEVYMDAMDIVLSTIGNSLLPLFKSVALPTAGGQYDYTGKVKYYEFKYYSFHGEYLNDLKEMDQALNEFRKGVNTWFELHEMGYYGIDYYALDPLKEGSRYILTFASRLCSLGFTEEGIPLLYRSVDLMEQTLEGIVTYI